MTRIMETMCTIRCIGVRLKAVTLIRKGAEEFHRNDKLEFSKVFKPMEK